MHVQRKRGQVYVYVYLIAFEHHVNVCRTQQVILKQFILVVIVDLSFNPVQFKTFLFISFPNLIEFSQFII